MPAGRPDFSTARVIAPGHERAGDRVGRVGLHDDGAAGGEGGGGVAARGGEGEREVARAEDRDRAERHHPLADVGARQRRTVRHRGVDPDAEVVALADDGREHPQLSRRTPDLTRDAALGQPALADRLGDDRLLVGLDLGRDRLQEGAAILGGGGAVGAERLGRCRGGGGDVGLLGVGASDDGGGGGTWTGQSRGSFVSMRRVRRSGQAFEPATLSTRVCSSSRSASSRSASGGRTGPAGRPTAARPALTIDTA